MTAPRPGLAPAPEELPPACELTIEERMVQGAPVRLFTFPGGSEDAARTVVCLPGLGASGRSFASLVPLQWNMEALAHPDARLPGRLALLGSSFGSLVSLAFTLAHPERLRAQVLVPPGTSDGRPAAGGGAGRGAPHPWGTAGGAP